MELDQILKGETPKTETVESKPEPKAETPEAAEAKPDATEQESRQRDEKGRFAKGEKQEQEPAKAEPPSAQDDQEPTDPVARGHYARARDERKKRQEMEKELLQLRQQMAQIQNPPPDPHSQPHEYQAYQQQEARRLALNNTLNLSEKYATAKYGQQDVEKAQALFQQAAQANPALYEQFWSLDDPYDWLLTQYRQYEFLQEAGNDPGAYRKKLKEQFRKEWEAEHAGKGTQSAPPPSLASVGSGTVAEAAYQGPPSLKSILKR